MIWRLLLDGAASGAWNMAVDEALLLSYGRPRTPPTLRFYSWQPPCVSLGRFQFKNEGAGTKARGEPAVTSSFSVSTSSFDVVRRPTGGRAVLHQHEITYAVVISERLLPAGARSVVGAYRWLSSGFIAGLERLGVAAALARSTPAASHRTTNCFASAAQCDFLVDNRKLIGAAQCRKQGIILQHGSLLLDADRAAWEAVVGGSMQDTVTLKSLGVTAPAEAIIQALCAGVESALQVSLQPGVLSEQETALAHRLRYEKYSCPAWNEHGAAE